MDAAKKELMKIVYGTDEPHGFVHGIYVLLTCVGALNKCPLGIMNKETEILIKLAALYYDVDSHNPSRPESDNLSRMLMSCSGGLITNEQLELVRSMTRVGIEHRVPDIFTTQEWFLYPHYSDSLETLGVEGLRRVYLYAKTRGIPFFTPETPRITSIEDLTKMTPPEESENYKGHPTSMMDHLYDRLLHIDKFPISNEYLLSGARDKIHLMARVCLEFGESGILPKIFQEWDQSQIYHSSSADITDN